MVQHSTKQTLQFIVLFLGLPKCEISVAPKILLEFECRFWTFFPVFLDVYPNFFKHYVHDWVENIILYNPFNMVFETLESDFL